MNYISTKLILLNSILMGITFAVGVAVWTQLVSYMDLPLVYYNPQTLKCTRVVNFRNGDAYNCFDMNVLLRRYRSEPDPQFKNITLPRVDGKIQAPDVSTAP